MTSLEEICRDLAAEQAALEVILTGLAESEWDVPTPAPGWTIRDQVSHLAFFDEVATQAVVDPEGFQAQLSEIGLDPPGYLRRALVRGRGMAAAEVLDWWRAARALSLEAFTGLAADRRVPWFGPPMKPVSFVTGRLMETWAHGQDVVDALGIERSPTPRLRHVAHMGVRARGFSFQINGRTPPEADVRVELAGPDGDVWSWGDSSENVVRGSALDFSFVVTQRRHPADTDLSVEGPVAKEWIEIAQAFAGPPGAGRRPGQFPKRART